MAVKNPTQWINPSGTGFFSQSSGAALTTLSGSTLTTLSLVSLTIDSLVYSPKYPAAWTKTDKNTTQWSRGNVTTIGSEFFVTNSGSFLVDNSGNSIVTTPTYTTGKNLSAWTASGV